MTTINPIIFPVDPSIVTAYFPTDDPCTFDTVNNLLILRVLPEDYQPLKDEERKIEDGYTSATITISTVRRGCEVTVVDGRREIVDVLEAMDELARASLGSYQLITLYDYHRVERSDLATGYTTRLGYFQEIAEQSGSVRFGDAVTSRRGGKGVRFTFYEGSRRP